MENVRIKEDIDVDSSANRTNERVYIYFAKKPYATLCISTHSRPSIAVWKSHYVRIWALNGLYKSHTSRIHVDFSMFDKEPSDWMHLVFVCVSCVPLWFMRDAGPPGPRICPPNRKYTYTGPKPMNGMQSDALTLCGQC